MIHVYSAGPEIIDTARKTQRILQVGSQRVSSVIYKKAQQFYQAGALGELNSLYLRVNFVSGGSQTDNEGFIFTGKDDEGPIEFSSRSAVIEPGNRRVVIRLGVLSFRCVWNE